MTFAARVGYTYTRETSRFPDLCEREQQHNIKRRLLYCSRLADHSFFTYGQHQCERLNIESYVDILKEVAHLMLNMREIGEPSVGLDMATFKVVY